MFEWNNAKWRKLSPTAQEKKASELLRAAYEESLQGNSTTRLAAQYQRLCQWSGWAPLHSFKRNAIADRFHDHLRRSGRGVAEHNLLQQVRRIDREQAAPPLGITLYLDRLRSAHNVGSIFRTAEALGIGRIALGGSTPSPENKQVRDASMGTTAWVDWIQVDDLTSLPRPILAMETSQSAEPIASYPFPTHFTLAVGNEEEGCSESLLQTADALIEIPLFGRKNSLNVANALAIAVYEIRRQRIHL